MTVLVTDNAGDSAENSMRVVTAGSDYVAVGPTRILDTRKGLGAPEHQVADYGTVKLKIAGTAGIPSGVTAVAVNLIVTDDKDGGYIIAYGDGDTRPSTSSVNFAASQTVADDAIVEVGSDGYIDLYNSAPGAVDLIADVAGYFAPTKAAGYTGLATPARLLDTRSGTGGYDQPVAQGHTVTLSVDGVGALPQGITAVAADITVANATGGGYVTAWPAGESQPSVSNIDFSKGQVIADAAVIPVGAGGKIELAYTGTGSIRLVLDVYGYFTASGASTYLPVSPYRLVDSRKNLVVFGPQLAYEAIALPLGFYATNSEPDPQITGIVLNTTVTQPATEGYLSVVPYDEQGSLGTPATSNLNFTAGATVPNLTFATPGTYDGSDDGMVAFVNMSAGSIQLVVDLYGYFMAG